MKPKKILHTPPWWGKIISFIIKPDFWETTVTDEGLQISRWIGKPLVIPWQVIDVIDLQGLGQTGRGEFKAKPFLLLRLTEPQYVKKACTFSSPAKTWYAAQNVLGLVSICKTTLPDISRELTERANQKSISLELLWLPE